MTFNNFYNESCACEICTDERQQMKATPYDRPERKSAPAPMFFPHSGSPSVVEKDLPYEPRGMDARSSAPTPPGAPRSEVTGQPDDVNQPAHYQSRKGIEAIDCIEAACEGLSGFEGYCIGNAMKYLFRWKKKGGSKDLEKARWYINRLLGDS